MTQYYIDPYSGSDVTGQGTLAAPWQTGAYAVTQMVSSDTLTVVDLNSKGVSGGILANTKVAKAGDTMTGPLTLSADPTAILEAVTKEYADGNIAGVLAALGALTNNYFIGYNAGDARFELMSVLGAGGAPNGAAGGGLRGSYPNPLLGGTRVVRVDSTAGGGDYQTVAAALAYIATQTRTASAPWGVEIGPGDFVETAPLTLPTYTYLNGKGYGINAAMSFDANSWFPSRIKFVNAAGGACIICNGFNAIGGLMIHNLWGATQLAADAQLILANGSLALDNVHLVINGQANAGLYTVTGVKFASGSAKVARTYTAINANAPLTNVSIESAGNISLSIQFSWVDTGSGVGILNSSTGFTILRDTFVGGMVSGNVSPLTADLKTTSTGKILIGPGCMYRTQSEANAGTIQPFASRAAQYLPNSAPVDGDIINSQAIAWLDETNHQIVWRVRDSAGNLHTVTSPAWT